MKSTFKTLLAAVAALLFSMMPTGELAAQKFKNNDLVKITTVDGNDFVGKILSQNETEFRINTETLGEIAIPKLKIKDIEKLDKNELRDGQLWERQPQESRHFFGPSGYGLRKGEGYYQNTGLFLNQVNHGITDNFSIGGGILPFPFFAPVWFTPKLSFPYQTGKGSAAIGVLYINALGWGDEFGDGDGRWGGAGMVYGANTWGTRDKQVTLGMGYGFADGSGLANYPTFMLSTIQRNRSKWAFISENYLIPSGGGDGPVLIISAGARYLGKTVTVDFGAFTFASEDIGGFPGVFPQYSIAFPWRGKAKK